ncbi:MAG TPA: cupredoxin domain-containing protein [Candidatus Saccharimonadales bacterium]|nr:cupredoxin domain-containing protein [Candidatus Saccharimonadales bacterium]
MPDAKQDREQRVLVDGGYAPETLVVAAGMPTRVIFHRSDSSPCSEEVVFPAQGVRATLPQDQDVAVDLPASEPGEYEFHCGMGMLHGRLQVRSAAGGNEVEGHAGHSAHGGCGGGHQHHSGSRDDGGHR